MYSISQSVAQKITKNLVFFFSLSSSALSLLHSKECYTSCLFSENRTSNKCKFLKNLIFNCFRAIEFHLNDTSIFSKKDVKSQHHTHHFTVYMVQYKIIEDNVNLTSHMRAITYIMKAQQSKITSKIFRYRIDIGWKHL